MQSWVKLNGTNVCSTVRQSVDSRTYYWLASNFQWANSDIDMTVHSTIHTFLSVIAYDWLSMSGFLRYFFPLNVGNFFPDFSCGLEPGLEPSPRVRAAESESESESLKSESESKTESFKNRSRDRSRDRDRTRVLQHCKSAILRECSQENCFSSIKRSSS